MHGLITTSTWPGPIFLVIPADTDYCNRMRICTCEIRIRFNKTWRFVARQINHICSQHCRSQNINCSRIQCAPGIWCISISGISHFISSRDIHENIDPSCVETSFAAENRCRCIACEHSCCVGCSR